MSADPLPALNEEQQRKHAHMVLRGWRFIYFGCTLYEVRDERGTHLTARYTLASAVDAAWHYMRVMEYPVA